MAGKTKKVPEEHPFYHDTWKLLKNYRDVAWNLELARQDLQAEFRAEYGTDDRSDVLESINADTNEIRIESFARSLERSRKMMQLLDKQWNPVYKDVYLLWERLYSNNMLI